MSFFFNQPATTENYTLSLHDALPISMQSKAGQADWINLNGAQVRQVRQLAIVESLLAMDYHAMILDRKSTRLNSSHTVISYAVFCLKKKTKAHKNNDPSPALNSPLSH